MNTYTSGPWHVHDNGPHWNNPSIPNYDITFGDDGECVAEHVYELSDAKLIAAAPDLLEALQTIVANGGIGPEEMFHAARAAIAKATT